MAETPVELLPPEADGPRAQTAADTDADTESSSALMAFAHGWFATALDGLAYCWSRFQEHSGDLLVGGLSSLFVAATGWLCSTTLTLAVWATAAPANSHVAMPLHVAGQLWLAAHHVMLHTPDGPFGLSPLGFSILPVGALVLAGRHAARRHAAGLWALAAAVLAYPLAALIIAWSAASGSLHAELGAAVGYPLLIAACGYGAGLLSARATHLDRWATAAVRGGTGALAVLVSGAALLGAVAIVLRFPEVTRMGAQIGQGAAGSTGLFLIDLALAPNLVIWALGFVTGPGFAVGDGSSVRLTGVAHGSLPGLPILQAVPGAGQLPWWTWLALVVPVGAGVAALLLVWRSARSATERAAALGAAAPAVGAVAGAAAVLSGGPVAAGAMSDVGPVPWQVGLAVLIELGVMAGVGFGLWYAIDHGRGWIAAPGGTTGELEEPSGLDDDRLGDHVRPRLVLGIPEGPQVVEDARQDAEDDEQPVQEQPEEAEPAADRQPVDEAGEPDPDGALAEGLAGAPGEDGVVDRPDEAGQADDIEDDVRGAVDVGPADGAADDGDPVVEQESGDALPPAGEGGHPDW
jgi:Family of unknown function (DUF6350)